MLEVAVVFEGIEGSYFIRQCPCGQTVAEVKVNALDHSKIQFLVAFPFSISEQAQKCHTRTIAPEHYSLQLRSEAKMQSNR